MLKFVLYFFFVLLLLPKSVFASVNVQISGNAQGSNSNVNVNSYVSSSQQSSNNNYNQTDIVIESNGEKKEYHGSEGKVELKSTDGKSSVSVNSNGTPATPNSSSSVNSSAKIIVNSDSIDSSASAWPEATVAGIFKEAEENKTKSGLWEFVKKEFELLFSLFH